MGALARGVARRDRRRRRGGRRCATGYSPRFVASLVSDDAAEHDRFYAAVDAPFVGDGFTRWVDGQYALDTPELGLSNWQGGRLLGRGGVLSGDSVYTVRYRARIADPDAAPLMRAARCAVARRGRRRGRVQRAPACTPSRPSSATGDRPRRRPTPPTAPPTTSPPPDDEPRRPSRRSRRRPRRPGVTDRRRAAATRCSPSSARPTSTSVLRRAPLATTRRRERLDGTVDDHGDGRPGSSTSSPSTPPTSTVEAVTVDGAPADVRAAERRAARPRRRRPSARTHRSSSPSPTATTRHASSLGVRARRRLVPDAERRRTSLNEPDGARTWLPSNDHPSDKATWRFELTVPAGVTAVANGQLVEQRPGPDGDDVGVGAATSRWRRTSCSC